MDYRLFKSRRNLVLAECRDGLAVAGMLIDFPPVGDVRRDISDMSAGRVKMGAVMLSPMQLASMYSDGCRVLARFDMRGRMVECDAEAEMDAEFMGYADASLQW